MHLACSDTVEIDLEFQHRDFECHNSLECLLSHVNNFTSLIKHPESKKSSLLVVELLSVTTPCCVSEFQLEGLANCKLQTS